MTQIPLNPDGSLLIPAEMLSSLRQPGDLSMSVARTETGLTVSRPESRQTPAALLSAAVARKNLTQDIQFIKGVGPRIGALLHKKGIKTIEDALFTLPLRYEDRRKLVPIRSLTANSIQVFTGTVSAAQTVSTRNGRKTFEVQITDTSGSITCRWFQGNPLWLSRQWTVGKQGLFIAEPVGYGARLEIHHPEVEWLPEGSDPNTYLTQHRAQFGGFIPVYPLTEGIHQKAMRSIMHQVVSQFVEQVVQAVPPSIVQQYGLQPLAEALQAVHTPSDSSDISALQEGRTIEHRSLVFDEFFHWELGLALKRRGIQLEPGISFQVTHRYTKELLKLLPFSLTEAQRRVLSEIKSDMMSSAPMYRLVQGDVGSGKTLVALMAALVAVENDYQVAIMAPTEILAEQHWHNIHMLCEQIGIEVVLLTAACKGSARASVLERIASGAAQIVIGTHAVIQDKVHFHRLGLGIIDEQHRFGVLQRSIIKQKGLNPDILVMTATPIPRTLAMTVFGDLSLSVIDQLPPGRTPVTTRVLTENRRSDVYRIIREQISAGRQGYLIYPLVEESEKLDLKAATQMADSLATEHFPDLRIGLLHGKLKPDEKEQVMQRFKAHELDLLVATTVIEVGIDVPNATVMVIEHAERFGLSQLHQLRGRVGRGSHTSYCLLVASNRLSDDSRHRLSVMESSSDGFVIAEKDLEIRGPGDFLGTRQSGLPDFKIASIIRDGAMLERARGAAEALLVQDPELSSVEGHIAHVETIHRFGTRLELAGVA